MKKYLIILSVSLAFLACGGNSKTDDSKLNDSSENMTEFVFKINGLNDTIVADSIWKMIFTVEGIDQIQIKTNDSIVIIKADKTLIEAEALEKEIINRGGIVLNQ